MANWKVEIKSKYASDVIFNNNTHLLIHQEGINNVKKMAIINKTTACLKMNMSTVNYELCSRWDPYSATR